MIHNYFGNPDKNKMEIETDFQDPEHDKKPWIEKYRPMNLSQVVFQDDVVQAFKGIKETGKMPHLLLYGPPGTGKTSAIIALTRELFGRHYKERVMEMNASDD